MSPISNSQHVTHICTQHNLSGVRDKSTPTVRAVCALFRNESVAHPPYLQQQRVRLGGGRRLVTVCLGPPPSAPLSCSWGLELGLGLVLVWDRPPLQRLGGCPRWRRCPCRRRSVLGLLRYKSRAGRWRRCWHRLRCTHWLWVGCPGGAAAVCPSAPAEQLCALNQNCDIYSVTVPA
jgi:hypothetical protein